MSGPVDLQALRESIEAVDREILKRLKQRMELVEGVARAKLAAAIPFRDPLREEQVLSGVRQTAADLGLDAHEIERLFRLVMEMSISRQQSHIQGLETVPLRVAYPGVEGSVHHRAAQRRYAGRAGGALLSGYETFHQVADEVRSGRADVGLLPIESTRAGSVNEIYDLLAEGGLTITAETLSTVEYQLLGLQGSSLEDVRIILSHPQVLKECEQFLRGIPWARVQTVFDTAAAVQKVKQGHDRSAAAIAEESEGRLMGLQVIHRGVHSGGGEYLRHVEVARETVPCAPGAPCKTSILFVLDDRPGALREVLGRLANHQINLTKLESRPLPGTALQYRFYMDLEGHVASQQICDALEEIRPLTTELRILGAYPSAQAAPAAHS
jgi:chorismate mutase/prephenate dehydratase